MVEQQKDEQQVGASSKKSAIVVGGGLAGLSAAYRLTKLGWNVKLLEVNDYPGGRATSIKKQGYLIDTGATGIGDCYTEYMALVDELGLTDKVVVASQTTGTIRDNKIHYIDGKHPQMGAFFTKLFSWKSKLTMLRVFSDLKKMGDKMNFQDLSVGYEYDDETAEAYSLRRLNREILDYFVDPILRALVVARASAVSKLELMNALNGLFGTTLLTTLGGVAALPKALASNINIHYQCNVTHVSKRGGGVHVVYQNAEGEKVEEQVDACVLATLLPAALEICPELIQQLPEAKALSEDLHYVPGVSVALGYKKKTDTDAIMVLIPAKEVADITLFWLDHNKATDRAPEGHSLFYLYYDDAVADEAMATEDDALVKRCSSLIESYFPELKGQLDMNHVTRWDGAVPLPAKGMYTLMYSLRQAMKEGRADGPIQLAGDYLSCVGQNTAVVYGELAAQKLHSHN